MVEGGIILIKIWLEVSKKEQQRRFEARIVDPLRQWKLSPMDLESFCRWYDYSHARDEMLDYTDTEDAPWFILNSDNKRKARLNCMEHILKMIPYKKVLQEKVVLGKRPGKGRYDDAESLKGRRKVEEKY